MIVWDTSALLAALWFESKAGGRQVRFASGDGELLSAARKEELRVIPLRG